ncbi:MAG: heme lyase CcmF/NrfE family subunit [Alphaproteobacteria bacterium]|nr:MAG: heme lyase CcmF/NrfE family subunit [Alphaproteobacteria bacterium]
MIAELGHYALILALFVAVVQSMLPLMGAARRDATLMAVAPSAANAQLLCCGIAFAALTYAYVTSDFSVANVYQNSHTDKPMLYKVSGVWGNHEGSLILWVVTMALFGAAVGWFGAALTPSLRARVIGVQGLVAIGFLLFILFTSNPFERLSPAPIQGEGLNPLLQDPGLAFHPPMLYLGYVGFSLTFSFAIAGLLEGRLDAAWARWVRPWVLAAWAFLTAGIALGSWWAYYELGWGGWWFWDPVENASFMPWLLGTALLHSAIVVEKRDALKRWTVLLAILTFALSLLGTFLVRSGILTSVHSFAVDPTRGMFVLLLLAAVVGGGLALYAWRAPTLEPGGLFQPISREGGLVLNNLLLTTATATVFLGTLYPLFLEVVGGGRVSVGPPYFNATFIPLMVPLVAAMAVGPLLAWKRADIKGALQRLWAVVAVTVGGSLAVLWLDRGGPVLAPLGIAMALWLILGTLVEVAERIALFKAPMSTSLRRLVNLPRAAVGLTLGHVGCGLAILGMTGSLWTTEVIRAMRPGDVQQLAGYDIRFDGVEERRGANFLSEQGTFTVMRDNAVVWVLKPEKRRFDSPPMVTTEAAIKSRLFYDLYLVLGEPDRREGARAASDRWGVRMYHEPMVPFIWLGAVVMVIGGLVSLSDRRFRIGAPTRRAVPAGTATGAPAE